ncbi:MAG: sigma-70 family RNA polymerase sigma factor [Methylophilaceae bacterium]|nr:sigma-70 family RNA polymerase sigma factor [Methylophilaceae bacterium]
MKFDRAMLNSLFRYCLALCGERENACDLLHDALEKYLRDAPQDVQEPVAYIRRIARNGFFDQCRRQRIISFETLGEPDAYASTERDLEAAIVDRLTLEKVWLELTSPEREVVYLWAVDGLSASEIALQLGLPRATVLSRLRRLRLRMGASAGSAAQGREVP